VNLRLDDPELAAELLRRLRRRIRFGHGMASGYRDAELGKQLL